MTWQIPLTSIWTHDSIILKINSINIYDINVLASQYTEQMVTDGQKRWYERVEEFKYLGTTLTNHNSIREEIKSRMKSENACYHLVQNLLSSSLLAKHIKIMVYRSIILLDVSYGCETWSLIMREERRLRVFENRLLRRIIEPKGDEVTGE